MILRPSLATHVLILGYGTPTQTTSELFVHDRSVPTSHPLYWLPINIDEGGGLGFEVGSHLFFFFYQYIKKCLV